MSVTISTGQLIVNDKYSIDFIKKVKIHFSNINEWTVNLTYLDNKSIYNYGKHKPTIEFKSIDGKGLDKLRFEDCKVVSEIITGEVDSATQVDLVLVSRRVHHLGV